MTLIDKAEALLPCPFCGGEAETTLGPIPGKWGARCKDCDVWRDDREATEAVAIAAWNRRALPARGVGVKPLVWQPIVKGARRPVGLVLLYRKSVTAEDKLVAAICKGTPETSDEILLGKWRDGAWRQWHTGWTVNGVTHWMTLPKPPSMIAALAPTDAAHVNETPKSEPDAGNVLTAAQAPAEDAYVKGETAGQMLERLGMDGVKWAAEFRTTALRLGYSDMDEGWLIGWFCNAIMAGYDRSAAQAREAALHPDDMLPEAIRLIRQEASRDHSQDVVTGLKHIALLLEQLIGEART